MTPSEDTEEEHIYLEVFHIQTAPPLPPVKSKLTYSVSSVPINGAEPPKRRWSWLNIVLVSMVVMLSVLCCVLTVLYVSEMKTRSFDERQIEKSLRAIKYDELNCKRIKSEMERNKFAYETNCPADECTPMSFLFHRRNASDYVISRGGPTMKTMTVCFWVKPNKTSHAGHDYYVSYAEPDGEEGFGIVEPDSSRRPRTRNRMWHSFCWTWSSLDGRYQTYEDGTAVQEGVVNRGKPFVGGGTWVLGRSADSIEEDFNGGETMQGEITAVNVWDKLLNRDEVLEISKYCLSKHRGNVKSWGDFKSGARGQVRQVERPTCCKVIA